MAMGFALWALKRRNWLPVFPLAVGLLGIALGCRRRSFSRTQNQKWVMGYRSPLWISAHRAGCRATTSAAETRLKHSYPKLCFGHKPSLASIADVYCAWYTGNTE
jgi:hypothetical protein